MPNVSGVGISFGADRIYDVLLELNLYPDDMLDSTQLLFVSFGDQELLYAQQWANKLRKKGIRVEVFPETAKIKKQMAYANAKHISLVAIVGENEMNKNVVMLKDMQTGEQKEITFDELVAHFN
jgi:histidyl-tRNA synthetase